MDRKKYRYNHIGIPTDNKLKNETYLPDYEFTKLSTKSRINIET